MRTATPLLVLSLACCAQEAVNTQSSLLRNGSFTTTGKAGVADGWLLSGGGAKAAMHAAGGPAGEPCQEIRLAGGNALATLWQQVKVERAKVLLFSMWVKADERVVVRVGRRLMSYTQQGRWQHIADLVRTGKATTLKVEIRVGGLLDKPSSVFLATAGLRPIEKPELPPREAHGTTRLVANGQPNAVIVLPAQPAIYPRLARKLQATLAKHTGARLPVMTDAEALEASRPVLKPAYRGRHLILLGRLGTNRAMWPAYGRFLCAADGYYPGGDGYVVRTAANVLRNGKNHIILGGSTEAAVRRAVAQFIKRVQATPTQDGNLDLPWLLDVELGGACRAAFEADDKLWATDPWNSLLPPKQPGYGTVRRWYHNAMAYYWSGWPSYKQRMLECLTPVLHDQAHTHHYLVEFLVRAYDMIDDGDALSAEQREAMDALIAKNFWEFLIGPDLGWMTTFSPPYDAIRVINRHSIAPWMADVTMADFVHDYLRPTGDLRDIVEYRREEKHRFFRHLVAERWAPSLPGASNTGHEEELPATLFRYALDHDRYEFFNSGHARRALGLDKLDHLTGHCVRPAGRIDHHLPLGILASYYRDGRYLSLLRTLPMEVHPTGHFQGRYVNGVHRYVPGPELAPQSPDAFTGVRVPAMMPHNARHFSVLGRGRFARPTIPASAALDFVAFRSGFERDDDYFAVNGLAGAFPPGIIMAFAACGGNWLGPWAPAGFSPATERYFDQNALHVQRTDRWLTNAAPYASAAQLNWKANLHRSGGVSFTLEPFMGARWRRDVVWLRPRLFVVRDVVTALEDGRFEMAITWRPNGRPAWDGSAWTSATDAGRLRLTPLSTRFHVSQNAEAFNDGRASELRFRQVASARMRAGESVRAITVLQAMKAGDTPYAARLAAEDRLSLSAIAGQPEPIVVSWKGAHAPGFGSDAEVLAAGTSWVNAMSFTRVTCAGEPLLTAREPASAAVDWAAGKATVDASRETRLAAAVAGGRANVALKPGLQRFDLPKGRPSGLAAAMSQAAQASEHAAAADQATPPRSSLEAIDASPAWEQKWSYAGMKRAAPVAGVSRLADDLADLRRVVRLAEIRAVLRKRMWEPARLPDAVWTTVPDRAGRVPPFPGPAWRKVEAKPQWRPGVKTGNYGQADRVAKAFQFVRLDGRPARFVKAMRATELIYYDADRLQPGSPLRLEVANLDGDREPEVAVLPAVWPPFVRKLQEEDCALAVLDAKGRELWRYASPVSVQTAQVADPGRGRQIVFATADARIVFVAPGPWRMRGLDLFAMHRQFNAAYGRPNTRHPAGGYTMPFALGFWRPGADGARKMVIARYHSFSFLNGRGRFEGVLSLGSYVQPGLLPRGIDFNRDGVEEQLCIARGALFHLDGSPTPEVRDPGGAMFYPQVYAPQRIAAPAWDRRLSGGPIRCFEPLPWGGNAPRYVLIARDDYLGIYDGLKRKWAFTWVPVVLLRTVAVAQAGADSLHVLAVSADDLLWELSWRGDLSKLADFRATRLPDRIVHCATRKSGGGEALLCGERGLYVYRSPERLRLISRGAYRHAQWLPRDGSRAAVVAITGAGDVVGIEAK